MTSLTATELARSLSDILNRVRYRGERFEIERNGETIATLAPAGPTLGVSLRDLEVYLNTVSLPDSGFADDLEAIQASQEPPSLPS